MISCGYFSTASFSGEAYMAVASPANAEEAGRVAAAAGLAQGLASVPWIVGPARDRTQKNKRTG